MRCSRVIGLYGCGQTDICVYLANILENAQYRVLVIDNSFGQKMGFCIPRPAKQMNTVTFKEVDYCAGISVDAWKREGYDYVVVDMGTFPQEEELAACDEIFLVTGCERAQLETYRSFILDRQKPQGIIFRNFCRNYMDERSIAARIEEDNCFVTERYFLPFSEPDECGRVRMQYEGYRDFLYLSRAFEKVLLRILRDITKLGYQAALGCVRSARRGECL